MMNPPSTPTPATNTSATNNNSVTATTVTRDAVTLLLEGKTLPKGEYIELV